MKFSHWWKYFETCHSFICAYAFCWKIWIWLRILFCLNLRSVMNAGLWEERKDNFASSINKHFDSLFAQVSDGSLTVLSITREDRGAYTCRAFSPQGEAVHTTRLLVQGSPRALVLINLLHSSQSFYRFKYFSCELWWRPFCQINIASVFAAKSLFNNSPRPWPPGDVIPACFHQPEI